MKQTPIIVHNLSVKQQGNTMLDAISFQLDPNEHLAVIGSSGSGKTTLAKALCGRIFFQGTIEFGGEKPLIGYVEQHYHFRNRANTNDFYYQQRYNSLDSSDASTVTEALQGVSNDQSHIEELLLRLQLSHRSRSPLLHLSSGEHKRFQVIKALLAPSQKLVLDEPYTGLDFESRKQLEIILCERALKGTQIILVTAANEIPSCLTYVAHLEDGKLKNFKPRAFFGLNTPVNQGTDVDIKGISVPAAEYDSGFDTAVRMVNVSVAYDNRKILDNVNWTIRRGEKWQLRGHNGAGKSTLLSLIYGDNPQAYANEIYLFDKRRGSGESIWDIKQKIGYVSPELQWYFDKNITVFEAIASGIFDTVGLYRKLSNIQHRMVEQWLDALQLSHLQHKPVSTISTGEQRLTLLVRAFVKDPPLLLLDEPCQGLDDHQTQWLIDFVDTLCVQFNKTLVYISHYDHEVPECIDNVLELTSGKSTIYSINKRTAMAV